MEQAVNSYNKNNKKSLLWKGKELSRSSMANVLSIVRLSIQSKIEKKKKTRARKKTLRKELLKPLSPMPITLLINFQK
jgi:hypothetical protein